jgi:hypothetical protein
VTDTSEGMMAVGRARGAHTSLLRPYLEPDSLPIAACDVLSLFLAAVRPSLAPSYATFAANVSVAQCYECMLCGHMGLRRLTFLSSERRLRFKNVAPPRAKLAVLNCSRSQEHIQII